MMGDGMITCMSETRSRSGLLEASQMFCDWPVVLEQAGLRTPRSRSNRDPERPHLAPKDGG